MQLFNDYWKSTYDEIITWYPTFYRDVYEMREILKAEGKLIDDFKGDMQSVFDNCFIDFMDEEHLAAMEDWLNLRFAKQRSLAERKAALKALYSGHGHISATLLASIVHEYTGSDVEIYFEPINRSRGDEIYDPGPNMLYIDWVKGDVEIIFAQDIENLLERLIPAHIKWQSALTYRFPVIASVERKHYITDFPVCGTFPGISTIGRSYKADVQVDTSEGIVNAKKVVVTFPSCGTFKCGQYPEEATKGRSYRAEVHTDTTEGIGNATKVVTNFPSCGTFKCGQYPE